jgi:MFS family permease
MAQFVVVLDFTIVNVALPSIQHGLHVATTTLQWLVSGYAVAFGGFLLLGVGWPTCTAGPGLACLRKRRSATQSSIRAVQARRQRLGVVS